MKFCQQHARAAMAMPRRNSFALSRALPLWSRYCVYECACGCSANAAAVAFDGPPTAVSPTAVLVSQLIKVNRHFSSWRVNVVIRAERLEAGCGAHLPSPPRALLLTLHQRHINIIHTAQKYLTALSVYDVYFYCSELPNVEQRGLECWTIILFCCIQY